MSVDSDAQVTWEIPASGVNEAPLVCIQVNNAWIPILLGHVEGMYDLDKWLFTTQAQKDYIHAQISGLLGLISLAVLCDEGGELLRQDPENPCVLQQSADGINWTTAFDFRLCMTQSAGVDFNLEIAINNSTVSNYYSMWLDHGHDAFPDLPPTNYDGNGDTGYQVDLCGTIDAYVRSCIRATLIWLYIDQGLLWLGDIIGSYLFPVYGKIAIQLFVVPLFNALQETIDALLDENAVSEFICCWCEALQGEAYDYSFWADTDTLGCAGTGNQAIVNQTIRYHNQNQANYASFLNALQHAQGNAGHGLPDVCADGWCYLTDFRDAAWDVWEATLTYPNSPQAAVGLLSTTAITPNAGNRHWILIKLPETFDNAQQIQIQYSSGYPLYFEIRDEARNRIGGAYLAAAGTLQVATFDLTGLEWDNWHLECFNASAHGSIQWTLHQIKFYGTGTNPLGTDNC